jgi:hypothetical protein
MNSPRSGLNLTVHYFSVRYDAQQGNVSTHQLHRFLHALIERQFPFVGFLKRLRQ